MEQNVKKRHYWGIETIIMTAILAFPLGSGLVVLPYGIHDYNKIIVVAALFVFGGTGWLVYIGHEWGELLSLMWIPLWSMILGLIIIVLLTGSADTGLIFVLITAGVFIWSFAAAAKAVSKTRVPDRTSYALEVKRRQRYSLFFLGAGVAYYYFVLYHFSPRLLTFQMVIYRDPFILFCFATSASSIYRGERSGKAWAAIWSCGGFLGAVFSLYILTYEISLLMQRGIGRMIVVFSCACLFGFASLAFLTLRAITRTLLCESTMRTG